MKNKNVDKKKVDEMKIAVSADATVEPIVSDETKVLTDVDTRNGLYKKRTDLPCKIKSCGVQMYGDADGCLYCPIHGYWWINQPWWKAAWIYPLPVGRAD